MSAGQHITEATHVALQHRKSDREGVAPPSRSTERPDGSLQTRTPPIRRSRPSQLRGSPGAGSQGQPNPRPVLDPATRVRRPSGMGALDHALSTRPRWTLTTCRDRSGPRAVVRCGTRKGARHDDDTTRTPNGGRRTESHPTPTVGGRNAGHRPADRPAGWVVALPFR